MDRIRDSIQIIDIKASITMHSSTVSSFRLSEPGKVEEELLTARLRADRTGVAHAGEKGRALEHDTCAQWPLLPLPKYQRPVHECPRGRR